MIFGIESLSHNVQKVIGKNLRINKKDIRRIITICHDSGIRTKLNFIIGLPGQTEEDLVNIIALISESKPSEITINPLTPYPGTYFANNFRDLGVYYDVPSWWEEGSKSFSVSNKHLDYKDINTYSKLITRLAVLSRVSVMEGY